MYFGTSDGLLEFDGSNWKIQDQSRNTIIRAVATDVDGRLYTGSYNEFGYWKSDSLNQLQFHSLANDIEGGMGESEEIWHIQSTPDAVYFQSFSTIYKYDKTKVVKLKPPGNIMFLSHVRGKTLFQKIDGGIYELSQTRSFQILPGTDFFADKKVVFILPGNDNELLIGTEQHGVFIWKEGVVSFWHSDLQNTFRTKHLNKGIRLTNGDFAFGSILDGLFVLHATGNLKYHLNKQSGLPDNTVLSMREDDFGNLWLGLDRGIVLVDVNNPLVYHVDVRGELGTIYTAALFKGYLYLGTNHGVFYREDVVNDQSQHSDFQFIEGTQGQVWQLIEVNDQLLCGHNDGTFILNESSIRKISTVNGGWTTIPFTDHSELLLQGTYSGLITFHFDESGGCSYSHRVNDFLEPVKELVIDHSGAIWLAHPIEGLYRVALNKERTEISYLQEISLSMGLPSVKTPRIIRFEEDIFVKSDDDWYRYVDSSNWFYKDGNFRGVPLDQLEGRIIQGNDADWFEVLPTETIFHQDQNTFAFPVSLVGRYENIVILDSSRYLFCMNEGFALLDSRVIKNGLAESTLPVQITHLEILSGEKTSIAQLTDATIELTSKDNSLRLKVYQPVFNRKPVFRYYLEGADTEWTDWTEIPEKDYFNLPEGDYVFHVATKLGASQSTLKFTVLPHWSRSNWAMLMYLMCFGVVVWGMQSFYNTRLRQAKRKHEVEQQRLISEQVMRARNEKLQMDVVNKSKELANSTINLARKNEILLEIKTALRQLKKTSGMQITGKEYQHINHIIDMHLTSEEDWKLFEENFNQVHASFFRELKLAFPSLTPGDLQLAAYLKMNLSSKEIAPLLHISIRGIENKRYRLRKKMMLPQDSNLTEYMMRY
ncbi:MAG: hypothetical protein DRI69_05620 [Bacteroidetes bacterium]|nr:MAG: hypothetical protein DRI69_05620 [Bacteroidota bacterium]